MTIHEHTELVFQDSSVNSDKFYVVELQEDQGKFSTFVRWGRNGTAGQTGYKCQDVPYADAKKAYNKVVGEKRGKGYQISADSNQTIIPISQSSPVQSSVASEPKAGGGLHHRKVVWKDEPTEVPAVTKPLDFVFLPQLLNEIEESEVEKYINDPEYCAQEKHDGRRRGLHFESGKVTGYNKKGKEVVFPSIIASSAKDLAEESASSEFTIDGEEVGDILYAFDLLSHNGKCIHNMPYKKRQYKLWKIINLDDHIELVDTAYTSREKRDLYHKLKDFNKEGIVFKRLSGTHKVGYAHQDQIKFKFYSTASVVVVKHNAKNSLAMAVWDPQDKKLVSVGNVTMIGHIRPPIGSIIEVRFLYANKGGCLYQPNYIGPRDDMNKEDCLISKLKFKAVPDEEDT